MKPAQKTPPSLTSLTNALLVVLLAAAACWRSTDRNGIVFESSWTTALGNSTKAVTDGSRWDQLDDFGGGRILSVVDGGPPGYVHALRVTQEIGRASCRGR